MSEQKITKTFTITANSSLMNQIERFLGCLHLFTNWGHSSTLALSQDGDGYDECKVEAEGFDPSKYRVYADYLSNYSYKDGKQAVESVNMPLISKTYLAYRDEWQAKHGDSWEGEPQPWMED